MRALGGCSVMCSSSAAFNSSWAETHRASPSIKKIDRVSMGFIKSGPVDYAQVIGKAFRLGRWPVSVSETFKMLGLS